MRKQISITIRPIKGKVGDPDVEFTVKTRRSYRHAWVTVGPDASPAYSATVLSSVAGLLQLNGVEL